MKSCGASIATTRNNTVVISDGHVIKYKEASEEGFEFEAPRNCKLTRIAVTPDNDIVAVRRGGSCSIVQLALNGDLLKEFGSYGKGEMKFSSPCDVAVDAGTGRIFVSDSNNSSIKVLNPDLTFSNEFGTKGKEEGQFNHPQGIALDSKGVLYVCDTYNFRIQKFENDSEFIGLLGETVLKKPTHIAINSCRDQDDGSWCDVVYVLDEGHISIFSDGEYTDQYCRLSIDPEGLAVDELGNLSVCGCLLSR